MFVKRAAALPLAYSIHYCDPYKPPRDRAPRDPTATGNAPAHAL
jgi:hypothetical protein